jgi:DnaJ-class molecular chaperone
MMINCMRLLACAGPTRYSFAAVTKDQLNYYSVLEVDHSATETAIRAAYADLTKGLLPELDTKRFKELSEAFVILTDGKTRDAYDSLLKVRKTHYLSPEEEETRPTTRSLLSLRRQDK